MDVHPCHLQVRVNWQYQGKRRSRYSLEIQREFQAEISGHMDNKADRKWSHPGLHSGGDEIPLDKILTSTLPSVLCESEIFASCPWALEKAQRKWKNSSFPLTGVMQIQIIHSLFFFMEILVQFKRPFFIHDPTNTMNAIIQCVILNFNLK